MAVATYTSTTYLNVQPKVVHAGDQSISGQITWSAASTVGDVAFLCKLPHGAVIVDLIEDHTTGATSQGLSFGLARGGPGGSATFSCFIATAAQAAVNRRSVLGAPVVVSVSDNDPNRFGVLSALVEAGTTTTSLKVNFTVIYRMDGPQS